MIRIYIVLWLIIVANLLYSQPIKCKKSEVFTELSERAIQIRLKSSDFEDLTFLSDLLKSKRIVFLGESLHTIDNFNKMKFRVIQYLHEKLGFNVVVFESGTYECGISNLAKDSLSPPELLSHSLKVLWWVQNNCHMMEYFKSNNINIAGLDPNNVTAPLSVNYYYYIFKGNKNLAEELYTLDVEMFEYVKKRVVFLSKIKKLKKDELYKKKHESDSLDLIKTDLINRYDAFLLSLNRENVNKSFKYSLKYSIRSKIQELSKSNLSSDVTDLYVTYHERDSIMAYNLKYIVDSLYPQEKIIVWMHNAHIAKKGLSKSINKGASLGLYLDERIKKLSYVIALSGWGGQYSVRKKKYDFKNPNKKYFEYELFKVPYDNFFLEINCLKVGKNLCNWFSKPKKEFYGIQKNSILEKYDAVIFTKNNKASELINYMKENDCNCR